MDNKKTKKACKPFLSEEEFKEKFNKLIDSIGELADRMIFVYQEASELFSRKA